MSFIHQYPQMLGGQKMSGMWATQNDGVSDYYTTGAAFAGVTDGKEGTASIWVRLAGGDNQAMFIYRSQFSRFNMNRGSDNRFAVFAANAAGTPILDNRSTGTFTSSNTWHHVLASWKMNDTSHLFIDGVDQANLAVFVNDDIDYTVNNFAIAATDSGTFKLHGSFAELIFDPTYIDLSDPLNRARFRIGSLPADLGVYGERALGHRPVIYVKGDNQVANLGYGGPITTNGAPAFVAGPGARSAV